MAQKVQAPQRKPRAGGIRDLLGGFIAEPRLAVAHATGGLVWEDSGCGFPHLTRAGCYDDVLPDAPKTPEGITQYTTISPPIVQYKGVECYIGGDQDEQGTYKDQARKALEAGEEAILETRLANWAISGGTTNRPDITGAIGLVDTLAREGYVGQPLIIMGPLAAAEGLAAGSLVRENGRLVSALGTPVLVASMSANFVAAVGWPAVYASDVFAAVGLAKEDNLAMAIAERVYAIGVDCDFRAAAQIVAP